MGIYGIMWHLQKIKKPANIAICGLLVSIGQLSPFPVQTSNFFVSELTKLISLVDN